MTDDPDMYNLTNGNEDVFRDCYQRRKFLWNKEGTALINGTRLLYPSKNNKKQ